MMKIGLVTGEYPPMQGGVGAFTQELAKALAAQGHVVHIITARRARPPVARTPTADFSELLQKLGDQAEPLDIGYAQLHTRGRAWRWGDVNMVADIALRYGLDVVNIQYQPAAYNMRSAAVNWLPWRLRGLARTVVTFHDLRTPYLFPKAGRWREWVVRRMAHHADGLIVTNQADEAALTAAAIPTPLCQIPIGSNINAYQPHEIELQDVRESLGLKPNDVLLAYFGFVNESKGADTLITALAELDKRFHVVFVGGRTGSSDTDNNALFLAHLQRLIDAFKLEKRVHWTGFLSDVRVSAHLCAADLVVMPYKDGVSLRRGTLMAALAHGRPLLSTLPTHPVPELRHGENAWLIPPANPTELTAAIRLLAADASLRGRLGHAAQQVAQGFTWDKIATQTADFCQKLLAGGRE